MIDFVASLQKWTRKYMMTSLMLMLLYTFLQSVYGRSYTYQGQEILDKADIDQVDVGELISRSRPPLSYTGLQAPTTWGHLRNAIGTGAATPHDGIRSEHERIETRAMQTTGRRPNPSTQVDTNLRKTEAETIPIEASLRDAIRRQLSPSGDVLSPTSSSSPWMSSRQRAALRGNPFGFNGVSSPNGSSSSPTIDASPPLMHVKLRLISGEIGNTVSIDANSNIGNLLDQLERQYFPKRIKLLSHLTALSSVEHGSQLVSSYCPKSKTQEGQHHPQGALFSTNTQQQDAHQGFTKSKGSVFSRWRCQRESPEIAEPREVHTIEYDDQYETGDSSSGSPRAGSRRTVSEAATMQDCQASLKCGVFSFGCRSMSSRSGTRADSHNGMDHSGGCHGSYLYSGDHQSREKSANYYTSEIPNERMKLGERIPSSPYIGEPDVVNTLIAKSADVMTIDGSPHVVTSAENATALLGMLRHKTETPTERHVIATERSAVPTERNAADSIVGGSRNSGDVECKRKCAEGPTSRCTEKTAARHTVTKNARTALEAPIFQIIIQDPGVKDLFWLTVQSLEKDKILDFLRIHNSARDGPGVDPSFVRGHGVFVATENDPTVASDTTRKQLLDKIKSLEQDLLESLVEILHREYKEQPYRVYREEVEVETMKDDEPDSVEKRTGNKPAKALSLATTTETKGVARETVAATVANSTNVAETAIALVETDETGFMTHGTIRFREGRFMKPTVSSDGTMPTPSSLVSPMTNTSVPTNDTSTGGISPATIASSTTEGHITRLVFDYTSKFITRLAGEFAHRSELEGEEQDVELRGEEQEEEDDLERKVDDDEKSKTLLVLKIVPVVREGFETVTFKFLLFWSDPQGNAVKDNPWATVKVAVRSGEAEEVVVENQTE